jgi:hypothetical protein
MSRPEHDHERGQVMPFYGGLGISCHATSSRVKAVGVTSGIADVICFWERLGFQFFHETKMPGRRQTLEQHQFEADCMATDVPYVLGGIDEAMAFVIHMGVAEPAGVTVRVKPREKWPSKPKDLEMLIAGWKWSVARHDASAKFGYKGDRND